MAEVHLSRSSPSCRTGPCLPCPLIVSVLELTAVSVKELERFRKNKSTYTKQIILDLWVRLIPEIPEVEARCPAAALPAFRWVAGSVPRWSASLHDRRALGRLEAQPLAPGHSERSVGAQRSHSDLRHTDVKRVSQSKNLG